MPDSLRRGLFVAVAVVLAGAVALAARAATAGGTAGGYRTAVADRTSFSETLVTSGAVQPVSQVSLTFPVAGTVASVLVRAGQTVAAGALVATLDTTSLQGSVDAAESSVAASQSKLAADEAAESAAAAPGNSSPSGQGGNAAALARLIATQRAVDADASRERAAVQAAQRSCAAAPAPSPSPSPSAKPRGGGGSGGGGGGGSATGRGCSQDLAAAVAAAGAVSRDLTRLAAAETALSRASAPASQSSASVAVRSPGVTTATSVTPEQIAADQAEVDAAQAELAVAQQNLAAAQLRSPVAGEVASVSMTPGEGVSAGSANASILVVSPGSFEVVANVSTSDIGSVATGDAASVLPDGSTTPITGTVAAIGLVAGSNGYPVTIALPDPGDLYDGAAASVTITERVANDALSVPSSAVHRVGSLYYVVEIRSGRPVNVPVEVGVVGPVYTQIASGLAAGTQVVLANLSTPLPTSNSLSTRLGRLGRVAGLPVRVGG